MEYLTTNDGLLTLNIILFILVALILFGYYRLEKRVNRLSESLEDNEEAMEYRAVYMNERLIEVWDELSKRNKKKENKPYKWEI